MMSEALYRVHSGRIPCRMVVITPMLYALGGPVEEAVGPEPAQLSQWELPSWEEIVRAHSARVYRLAYRLTGNQHDAEDLTQEVFVRVFRSLSSYTPGTFEGWLHRITTNLFLDSARRRQRIRFEGLGRRGRAAAAWRRADPGAGVGRPAPRRRHPGSAAGAAAGLPGRGRALRHRGVLLRGDRGHDGREARHRAQPDPSRAAHSCVPRSRTGTGRPDGVTGRKSKTWRVSRDSSR